ncbi:MAG TPA: lipase family protein [Anaerolineae bacterium]|nr:lipase family protein [Anaerolineae bacterium]HXW00093.1 lipase family protein [Anaerolineae bacterium]
MRVRQQIYSALLLIILVSLACTIRMPENMAQYATPDPAAPAEPVVQSTGIPAFASPVITNATVLTPGVEASPAPEVILIQPPSTPSTLAIEPPVPAALAELSLDSLIKEVEFVTTIPADTINQLQAKFYPHNNQLPAQFAVDRFKLRFKSRNERGLWVSVRAEMFVPKVDAPAEFPLFIYGAGTTGINNLCAPLDEETHKRNWGQYQTHLASYAAQGFITILPHWQGYDDQTRKHNYFIAGLEASTLLDATRAAYQLFNNNLLPDVPARPAQAVFYGGYSQGGHGAFAALDAAIQYAPELPIKGVIGHATAPNVEALLRERPPLAPYIIYAYLNYYGDVIDPEAVFLPNWLPTFYADASTKCVDEAYSYYPADPKLLYRPEFFEALYGDRLADTFPAFKEALELNYVGTSPDTNVPIVLFHGETDTIVTPETHEHFVARLCNLGKNVSYKLYPETNHFQTRQASFVDSVTWMRNILSNQLPASQCSEFFNSQFQ